MNLRVYICCLCFSLVPLASAQELTLQINGASETLLLEQNQNFLQQDTQGNKHYKGSVKNASGSWVRLSQLSNQHWSGLVMLDNHMYFIESPVDTTRQSVHAMPASALTEQPMCGTQAMLHTGDNNRHSALQPSQALAASFASACSNVDDICVFADLELIFDQEYQSALNANLQGSTNSIINMLEGYYLNQFNIAFNIINQVFLNDATDIYSNETNANSILDDVYSRRCEQQFGAATCRATRPFNYDNLDTGPSNFILEDNSIVHFVTGRDFDGPIAGVAFSGANSYCNDFTVGTSNLSRSGSSAVRLSFTAAIIAHEIGHNLAANHDGDGNACPNSGFVMSAVLGSLPSAFSSCSEEVITQTMADNLNNDCATAPVDLSLSAGSVSGSPTVGSLLTINNAFSANSTENGFRTTGNASIEVTTTGASINSIDINGSNCSIASSANSASCNLSVVTGQAPSRINMTVAISGTSVSIRATDEANNLFRDTDPSNSNALVSFSASAVASSFSISATNIPITNSPRPIIRGTSDIPNGNVIRASINGVEVCNTTVSSVNWSCTPTSDIADGTQTIVLTGPGGAASNITVTIDTTAPQISANNVNSSSLRPNLSGTTDLSPSEGRIEVINSQGNTLCVAVIVSGQWSCTPSIDLQLGTQTLNVSATDSLGNTVRINLLVTITSSNTDSSEENGGGGGGLIDSLFSYLLLSLLLWRKRL